MFDAKNIKLIVNSSKQQKIGNLKYETCKTNS